MNGGGGLSGKAGQSPTCPPFPTDQHGRGKQNPMAFLTFLLSILLQPGPPLGKFCSLPVLVTQQEVRKNLPHGDTVCKKINTKLGDVSTLSRLTKTKNILTGVPYS